LTRKAANTIAISDRTHFGPKVKAWIKTMLGKAVDLAWQIDVAVAGGLLTNALQTYYFS